MMDDSNIIVSSTEIIKDKLYFATLTTGYRPKPTKNSKYFHIEDDIVYESFYFDFGPYHLCHLYQFCERLNAELAKAPSNKKIVFYTSDNETLRLNAAYLIGSYAIINLSKSPAWVHAQLTGESEWSLLSFRDVSGGPAACDMTLLDVFQGLQIALQGGFFDFKHFNEDEYLYYERVENGDLNWIIPDKMLAFSGPHAKSRLDHGYPLHSPEHYHDYFKRNNVTTIVRLNKKSYDARQFSSHGFEHRELFFVDGSVPSDAIVARFIRICEAAPGAVAVHCKAGLGRTGTLIGCYMMKHHGFSARQAIAWLRICRPGSVIGHQQRFLETAQARMHLEGEAYRRRHNMTSLPRCARGVYSQLPPPCIESTPPSDVENQDRPTVCTTAAGHHTRRNIARGSDKPVSLNTILNNVDNVNAVNNGNVNNNDVEVVAAGRKAKKIESNISLIPSSESCDAENNLTGSVRKLRPAAPLAPKLSYMLPTNNLRNANNTNLNTKAPPRILNSALKSHYNSKTSTFPPTRNPNAASNKISANLKGSFTGKSSFHGQRANLARNSNLAFNHGSNALLKTYTRKTTTINNNQTNSLNSVTSTLSALTENCTLNSNSGIKNTTTILTSSSVVETRTATQSKTGLNPVNTRKKTIIRSNSNSRKKLPKSNHSILNGKLDNVLGDQNSNLDLSSSDTNTTTLSADSLDTPVDRTRRKRDKSVSPEPMEQCYAHSVITADVTPDNYEETLNSQGNRLYKIKALRRRGPAGALRDKKDAIQTRSSSLGNSNNVSVKKK